MSRCYFIFITRFSDSVIIESDFNENSKILHCFFNRGQGF